MIAPLISDVCNVTWLLLEGTVKEGVAKDVQTALDFIFFFAIISCHLLLLIKIVCTSGWQTRGGHCSRLGLAVGSMLVILFSYVNRLHADLHLQSMERITRVVLVAFNLLWHYLPFVYATSLVAIGANSAVRRRFVFRSYRTVLAWNATLTLASWALGLAVVCPLVFTDVDWGISESTASHSYSAASAANQTREILCRPSTTQYRATLWLCNILPPGLAVVLSAILRAGVRKPKATAPDGTAGRLYNAVTDSQTIQSISYKYQYSRLDLQVQPTGAGTGKTRKPDADIDVEEEGRLYQETAILLACSVVLLACGWPWAVCRLLETYHAYDRVLSTTVIHMTSFWLSQIPFVVVPVLWLRGGQ